MNDIEYEHSGPVSIYFALTDKGETFLRDKCRSADIIQENPFQCCFQSRENSTLAELAKALNIVIEEKE